MNFVSRGGYCATLELYAPGQEFVRSARCHRRLVYVPPNSGVHTLFVRAPRGERSTIPYRLRATLLVERFEPLAGWPFHSRHRSAVRNGRAAVAFRPPSVGRWRVRGTYDGTRLAAPSDGGTARFTVEEPARRVMTQS